MEELESKKIIGLMSGTSCDSIDAGYCIVNPDLSCTLVDGINYEYPQVIREKIFRAFSQNITLEELCELNFEIGECFANASNVLIKKHGKPDLISLHGFSLSV